MSEAGKMGLVMLICGGLLVMVWVMTWFAARAEAWRNKAAILHREGYSDGHPRDLDDPGELAAELQKRREERQKGDQSDDRWA